MHWGSRIAYMEVAMSELSGTLIGGLVGFLTVTAKELLERSGKRKRFEMVIARELDLAMDRVNDKMDWLNREATAVAPPEQVVEVDGRHHVLGEPETFKVPLPFWTANFTEIISLISTKAFGRFSDAVFWLGRFEEKFAEMKQAFLPGPGDAKKMAAAVYADLRHAKKELSNLRGMPKPWYVCLAEKFGASFD